MEEIEEEEESCGIENKQENDRRIEMSAAIYTGTTT
jgi:hypothetical protein